MSQSEPQASRARFAGKALLLGCASAFVGLLFNWVTISVEVPGVETAAAGGNGFEVNGGRITLVLAVIGAVLGGLLATARIRNPRSFGIAALVCAALIALIGLLNASRSEDSRRNDLAEDIRRSFPGAPPEAAEQFARSIEVSNGPGPWISSVGGLVAVAGGVAGAMLRNQPDGTAPPAPPEAGAQPKEGDA